MYRFVQIERVSDFDRLPDAADVAALPAADFAADRADAHLCLLAERRLAARCSLWWTSPPPHLSALLGVIGHYAARDAGSGRALLAAACGALAAKCCTLAVGPMDGNTWRRYRFVTERNGEPPFFLEPDNPNEWPEQFSAGGFTAFARYRSTLNDQLRRDDPEAAGIARRLARRGVSIRTLDETRIDEELCRLHRTAMRAFCRAPLYQPLDEAEFQAQYSRLLPFVRPEFVLIAERAGETVGFLFALPDWAQHKREGRADTLIIKTVAVVPGREHAGLGRVLAWHCEERAAAAGFSRSIHALMAEPGTSLNISRGYARTMRGYTLFARQLQ
jgi:GNAT superfamily N-acetyltransferase